MRNDGAEDSNLGVESRVSRLLFRDQVAERPSIGVPDIIDKPSPAIHHQLHRNGPLPAIRPLKTHRHQRGGARDTGSANPERVWVFLRISEGISVNNGHLVGHPRKSEITSTDFLQLRGKPGRPSFSGIRCEAHIMSEMKPVKRLYLLGDCRIGRARLSRQPCWIR